MREQVCVYMCPWPRIQAALTDEWALNVTYRYDRGEQRTSLKKAKELRAKGEAVGDCIDCYQCVAVCPTGIDIRNGAQLECIMCGLCIDACDTVMAKTGRPTGLIAYDNEININRRLDGQPETFRPLRPRTIIYAAVIVLVGAVMLFALITRSTVGISVLHDRNPLYVALSDGAIRNAYTVRLLNKHNEPRQLKLAVAGVPALPLQVVGSEARSADGPVVTVGPDQTFEIRLLVTVPADAKLDNSMPVTFTATDAQGGETATARDHFVAR